MYKNFSRREKKWWGAVLLIALNFWAKCNGCQLSSSTSKTLTSWSFSRYYSRRSQSQHLPSKNPVAHIHFGLTNSGLGTSTLMTLSGHVPTKIKNHQDKTKQNPHNSLLHLTGKASYMLMIKSASNHCFFTPSWSWGLITRLLLLNYWVTVSLQRCLLWNSCMFRALWNSHRIYTHLCLNAYLWLLFMKNKTWLTDNGLKQLLTMSNCVRRIKLLPIFFKLGCLWSVLWY